MRGGRTVLVALALAVSLAGCGGASPPLAPLSAPRSSEASSPREAAVRFLARYVTSDGRVIRHDQGGDIVSEGQAYAMLLAEVAHRPALVRRIWSWTAAHLSRPDGLFAWHAAGSGQIEDPQSATDADVLIAYALSRYAGPDQAALRGSGRRIAGAVLANESVTLPDGSPLLVAGPWAKTTSPPTVDPSYLMPSVFDALARFTGDTRWSAAGGAAVRMVAGLTGDGRQLPPDWAELAGDRLVPAAEPRGGAAVQYGLDAARVPIWFATACDDAARSLAAAWWHNVLSIGTRPAQLALTLGGATINSRSSPVTLLAGAATASAAGEGNVAARLRARADALSLRDPTYYGDAWAGLGPALLTGAINPCEDAAGG